MKLDVYTLTLRKAVVNDYSESFVERKCIVVLAALLLLAAT